MNIIENQVKWCCQKDKKLRQKISERKKALNISEVAKRRTSEAIKGIDKIITKIMTTDETVIEEANNVLKNTGNKL